MGIIAELATNVKQPLHWISMINDIVGDTYVECFVEQEEEEKNVRRYRSKEVNHYWQAGIVSR